MENPIGVLIWLTVKINNQTKYSNCHFWKKYSTKFEQHVDQMDMSPGRRHFSLRSGDIITIVQATLIKSYISLSGRAKANKSRIL